MESFGWDKDELIGNKTVEQVLREVIDIQTKNVKVNKLIDMTKIEDELKQQLNDCTLIDLAERLNYKVPIYMLEEPSIIPHIKPRFYSISEDPFTAWN